MVVMIIRYKHIVNVCASEAAWSVLLYTMHSLFSLCIIHYVHSRCELQSRQLLYLEQKCIKYCGKVGIPVKENVENYIGVVRAVDDSFVLNGVPFHIVKKKICLPCPRKEKFRKVIEALMRSGGLWDGSREAEIPTSWEKYGDLLLFNGDKYFKSPVWIKAG